MKKTGPIRAVVVDDSPTACDLLVSLLQNQGGMQVVGVGRNGLEAINLVKRLSPDVLAMDVRMPKMDGFEATREIMRQAPLPIVLVTATLMASDTQLTFEALRAGALTIVKKPGLSDPMTSEQLVNTVKIMSGVPVVHHWGRKEEARIPKPVKMEDGQNGQDKVGPFEVIGIASSTGGPGTLLTVLNALPETFPVPIMIVQHVTAGFASGMADWLDRLVNIKVRVAEHGERPKAGVALIAPDDYHMQVNKRGLVENVKGEFYKGLRPSANYLFHSMAQVYGPRCMGIILTGMGDDGVNGLEAIYNVGGLTVGQNEESCVVFGMPCAAAARQVVKRVLSPEQIAGMLEQIKAT